MNGDIQQARELLMTEQVDPAAQDNLTLKWACQNGFAEITRLLLAGPPPSDDGPALKRRRLNWSHVDPSKGKQQTLCVACAAGLLSAVQALLTDPRVDPCAFEMRAFSEAFQHGRVAIVKLLL